MKTPSRFDSLKYANWRSIGLTPVVENAIGMLSGSERSLLCFLAREYFSGRGAIIDAGAFLGASALALADGLGANPKAIASDIRVHSYDSFKIDAPYLRDFINTQCDVSKAIGDSFRDVFDRQVASVQSCLSVHEGDILQECWSGQIIEILFADICKTASINSHLLRLFFGYLESGTSVVIHQDYHHPFLPWIHITMEYLSSYFEIVVERVDYSCVFGLRAPIPLWELDKCAGYTFSPKEKIELMDCAINRLAQENRSNIALAKVILLANLQANGVDESQRLPNACKEFEAVCARYGGSGDYIWNTHAEEVKSWLQSRGMMP